MKKKVKQEINVEIDICNICKKEITSRGSNSGASRRIPMINGLFKMTTFDAHDGCVNRVIRESFKKYYVPAP